MQPPHDICIRVFKRIRQLRRNREMRHVDLIERSGISKTHLCDLENGRLEIGFC